MSMPHRAQRQHCYLCDLPRTPWAMLHDFSESVCRGCVNYEGPDRIEMIIEAARLMKQTHGFPERPSSVKQHPPGTPGRGFSHDQHGIVDQATRINHGPLPLDRFPLGGPNVIDYHPVRLANGLTFPHTLQRGEDQVGGSHIPRMIPGLLPPSTPHTRYPHPAGAMLMLNGPMSNGKPIEQEEEESSTHSSSDENGAKHGGFDDNAGRYPPHVQDTLAVLSSVVPFQVRFKKDTSLLGRIFSFDANVKQAAEYELKIYIEYPSGSGTIFNSVSCVSKQMYQDYIKDVSKGVSSGFKYLEYEMKHESGEWRTLSDFLSEQVRSFKDPINQEMNPVPFLDNSLPSLPSPSILARGPHRKTSAHPFYNSSRKRKGSPSLESDSVAKLSEEQYKRQQWMQNQTDSLKLTISSATSASGMPSSTSLSPMSNHHTPTPPDIAASRRPSPMAALMNVTDSLAHHGSPVHIDNSMRNASQKHNIHSSHHTLLRGRPIATLGPVSDAGIGSTMPGSPGSTSEALRCTICRERLEDTHFVQCPSVMLHKFCFPCSKDSITRQGCGSEVYCPSGKKCPLTGSNVPWAFMQGEIQTIIGEDYKETKIKKERDT